MTLNPRTLGMIGGGIAIALAMMRIPPPLYFTPIYLLGLLAAFDPESRRGLLAVVRAVPMVFVYFLFAVASLAWAEFPRMVFQELRGNILIPCIAFAALFHLCRRYGERDQFPYLVVAAWLTFLAGSLAAWLVYRERWMDEIFNGVGYYSTYLFMLAAVSLPFIGSKGRALLYPTVALLLWVTQQRVAWVVFPVIGLADLMLYGSKRLGLARALLAAVVVAGFSFGMMKLVVSGKPADAFHPEDKASGVVQHLAKNERFTAWKQWIDRGMESPLIGSGFGRDNVKAHFAHGETWNEQWLHHGHNIFLNNFLQLGLLGLALFVAANYQLLRYCVTHWQPFSTAAFLLVVFFLLRNQFDDFGFKRLLIVYAMLLGACISCVALPRHGRPDTGSE